MRLRKFGAALLLVGSLVACSSTTQQANRSDASASPLAQAEPTNRTAVSSVAPSITAASDGPVTDSMAKLQIGGERYSTMGDPNAPITMLEYSDFG